MSTQEDSSKGETATNNNETNPTATNNLPLKELQRLCAAVETIADVMLHNARLVDSDSARDDHRSPDYRALDQRAALRHQHWQGSVSGFKYPFFFTGRDSAQGTEGVSGDGIPWSSHSSGQQ